MRLSNKITMRLQWDYAEISMRLPWDIQRLPWDLEITMRLPWDYPEITMRLPEVSVSEWARKRLSRVKITMRLPWDYHDITMRLPWDYHAITMRLSRDYHEITRGNCALRLSRDYNEITMRLPCDYNEITMREFINMTKQLWKEEKFKQKSTCFSDKPNLASPEQNNSKHVFMTISTKTYLCPSYKCSKPAASFWPTKPVTYEQWQNTKLWTFSNIAFPPTSCPMSYQALTLVERWYLGNVNSVSVLFIVLFLNLPNMTRLGRIWC